MAAEAIKIRATAAKLYKENGDESIADYKTMPLDDLKDHIERLKGGKPAKASTPPAVNGSPAPAPRQKGKAAPAAPAKKTAPAKGAKGSARTSAPAKSTTRKSSPTKGKAATGTAKRLTAAAGKGKATPTQGKTKPAKGRATAKPKTGTAKTATAKRTRGKINGAARIDNGSINWKAEWNGGKTGKRKDVMDSLRKFKGDKDKVFNALVGNAKVYYKGHPKPEAMLRWLIGRVAFDFVTTTGQHETGTRDAHGTSTEPKNVRRRELREEAAKAARAATRAKAAKSGAKTATRGKAKTATASKGRGKR